MPRYKLTIEYDGTPYSGWQKQPDRPSVEGALMEAISRFCGRSIEVVGAGRTDSGVHATAQVAHIDLDKEIDPFRVMQGINYYLFDTLPESTYPASRIAVLEAKMVADDFHARFSAKKRHYLYRIVNRRQRLGLDAGRAWQVVEDLDEKAMQEATKFLIGRHDFTSFRDSQCQAKSPEKTLEVLNVVRRGNEIHINASARSFLHHQVRNMVGTLSLVGKGRWQPEDVKKALDARDRRAGGPTCPPDGLYLIGVDY